MELTTEYLYMVLI